MDQSLAIEKAIQGRDSYWWERLVAKVWSKFFNVSTLFCFQSNRLQLNANLFLSLLSAEMCPNMLCSLWTGIGVLRGKKAYW